MQDCHQDALQFAEYILQYVERRMASSVPPAVHTLYNAMDLAKMLAAVTGELFCLNVL